MCLSYYLYLHHHRSPGLKYVKFSAARPGASSRRDAQVDHFGTFVADSRHGSGYDGIVPRPLALLPVLAVLLVGTESAWACHPPGSNDRIHVSFLADADLGAMVKWAKDAVCIYYDFDQSLAGRRLAQSVILTVPGRDAAAVFEVLLHSMNLRTKGNGNRRHIVADGPETNESRESSERERADAERGRIFDHIETEIRKSDDTHFGVTRRGADAILANMRLVAHSLRVAPEMKGEHVIGFRIVGMKTTSVLGMLGLREGDVVQSLNGRDINTPDSALEAYAKLRSTKHLQAHLTRDGKPIVIDVKIE